MNEIVWPTIDSKHLIVDSKQMLILEKEMFSDGMPQEALMEKAGIQISRWLLKRKPLLKYGITVFIGPGHNGGDGAVIARELFLKGFLVKVWCPFPIKKTTDSYQKRFTPLPCSMCNKNVKFEEMLKDALSKKDFTHIATGHYARIKKSSYFEKLNCKGFVFKDFLLLRGADENKDQSYFLYSLRQELLSRLIFPLGEMKKEETRSEALRLGLRTAQKPESQDLCLVEHYGSMQIFIDKHIELSLIHI